MVVEISANDGTSESQAGFLKFEDRIILLRAVDEEEAREKGEDFAADYQRTTSWKVRKIVDAHEIVDAELRDGIEIYSAFIGREWANLLMTGGKSPVEEWKKQNPGKEVGEATVQEVIDAWELPPKEP